MGTTRTELRDRTVKPTKEHAKQQEQPRLRIHGSKLSAISMSTASVMLVFVVGLIAVVVSSNAAVPLEMKKDVQDSEPDLKMNEIQHKIIEAAKARNFDDVLVLAAKAKRNKEFEQVYDEMRAFHGYSTLQVDAFFSSLMMIIVSELGDKTFFIAAVLAMKNPRSTVLAGALGALWVMTVLSAAAGFALPNLIPRMYTHYASVCLFIFFGAKLLKDAKDMQTSGPSEELEEVEAELNKTDKKKNTDLESENGLVAGTLSNGVLWQAFTLTFLAEWGDRSQIATIALAAQKDPIGVTVGGIVGHAACTALAVMGGRMLAARISERTVAISGGLLFLVFAIHGLWQGGSSLNNA
uniref:GDT1 family protein n=1 Tax=Guillardia theta TaxID=55529 RepID=A0A7S4KUE4_GUITH|mmetsp:Transcript_3094/g.10417  ORF Transcript_3094/g.10417 Transcript_3094/m.10417 type:complete len:352 (+) Transcript_3094:189-1244(+)